MRGVEVARKQAEAEAARESMGRALARLKQQEAPPSPTPLLPLLAPEVSVAMVSAPTHLQQQHREDGTAVAAAHLTALLKHLKGGGGQGQGQAVRQAAAAGRAGGKGREGAVWRRSSGVQAAGEGRGPCRYSALPSCAKPQAGSGGVQQVQVQVQLRHTPQARREVAEPSSLHRSRCRGAALCFGFPLWQSSIQTHAPTHPCTYPSTHTPTTQGTDTNTPFSQAKVSTWWWFDDVVV